MRDCWQSLATSCSRSVRVTADRQITRWLLDKLGVGHARYLTNFDRLLLVPMKIGMLRAATKRCMSERMN